MKEQLEQINHKYDLRKVFIVENVYRFLDKKQALKFEKDIKQKGGIKKNGI